MMLWEEKRCQSLLSVKVFIESKFSRTKFILEIILIYLTRVIKVTVYEYRFDIHKTVFLQISKTMSEDLKSVLRKHSKCLPFLKEKMTESFTTEMILHSRLNTSC